MNHIKELRCELGMTQGVLASALGVTQGAITHYENNRRTPDIDMCRGIVSVFNKNGANVTLDDVFPPKEQKQAA